MNSIDNADQSAQRAASRAVQDLENTAAFEAVWNTLDERETMAAEGVANQAAEKAAAELFKVYEPLRDAARKAFEVHGWSELYKAANEAAEEAHARYSNALQSAYVSALVAWVVAYLDQEADTAK